MTVRQIIHAVQGIVAKHLDRSYHVILFGSQARGDARATSDVDIGIVGAHAVPWKAHLAIRREVEALRTLRRVDIVDLMSVRGAFRAQALEDGRDITLSV